MTGIVVVSGRLRSGTSLMMQMLRAAELTLLAAEFCEADENNRRGYFELEAVKQLARNPHCIRKLKEKR